MIFRNPLLLTLLPVLIILFVYMRVRFSERAILFSSDNVIKHFRGSLKVWIGQKIVYLRVACMALLVIALARPQLSGESRVKREGIAIMLSIDCSSTMLAEDLQLGPTGLAKLKSSKSLNRIDAVCQVARDFIQARPDDMIGIVAFAAQAYVVCPLTFDRKWLNNSLERVKVGLIKDATAIGAGILSSLNALKDVGAKSKVLILLTDGINNFGQVPPLVAAKAARSIGVKIYTIGIASRGQTPFPTKDIHGRKVYKNVRIDIDEGVLKEIANSTGAEYFRVTDLKSLEQSYKEIDKLEKVELEQTTYEEYKDIFQFFLIIGVFLLLVEIVLTNTFFRRIP